MAPQAASLQGGLRGHRLSDALLLALTAGHHQAPGCDAAQREAGGLGHGGGVGRSAGPAAGFGDGVPGGEPAPAALGRDAGEPDGSRLAGRVLEQGGPRPGDARGDGLERIKFDFEESVYWQLKAMVEKQ